MAASVGGKGAALISTCEADTILRQSSQGIQDGSIYRPPLTGRPRKKWQHRSIGSRNILLILTWSFIVNCSQRVLETRESKITSPWLVQFNDYIYLAAFAISCPIASLLAEVVIGRYKFISLLLRALWLLHITGVGISLSEYFLQIESTTSYMIGHYLVAVPASGLQGAFLAVAIPLGLDQIAGASNTNINALVMWSVWNIFSGFSTAEILAKVFYQCSHMQASQVSMIMSLLSVLLLSVGLILDIHFHHKLVKEPVTVNPVSLIFKVLKYAAKHKYPVQRSAFTYCENERPTRLDYGKSKYGGPFTTEQVEDVKTFWGVLVVILVICMLFSPLASLYNSYSVLASQFYSQSLSSCIHTISDGVFSPFLFITCFIPLYELLIYPCLRNRGPSILQSAGIGAAALIVSSSYGMIVEAARPVTKNYTIECMFTQNVHNNSKIIEGLFITLPFNLIVALALTLVYKSRYEFICAQAPYNMTSLLVGLTLMLQSLLRIPGEVLSTAFGNKWYKVLETSTCGVWFYLANLLMAILITVLLFLVVRRYKGRERDEITESQMLVEDIYYKYNDKR